MEKRYYNNSLIKFGEEMYYIIDYQENSLGNFFVCDTRAIRGATKFFHFLDAEQTEVLEAMPEYKEIYRNKEAVFRYDGRGTIMIEWKGEYFHITSSLKGEFCIVFWRGTEFETIFFPFYIPHDLPPLLAGNSIGYFSSLEVFCDFCLSLLKNGGGKWGYYDMRKGLEEKELPSFAEEKLLRKHPLFYFLHRYKDYEMMIYYRMKLDKDAEDTPPVFFYQGEPFSVNFWEKVWNSFPEKECYFIHIINKKQTLFRRKLKEEVLLDGLSHIFSRYLIKKATLVGLLEGEKIIWKFAVKYPEKVFGIILEKNCPEKWRENPKEFCEYLEKSFRKLKEKTKKEI